MSLAHGPNAASGEFVRLPLYLAGIAAAITRAVWRRAAPLAPPSGHKNIIKF